MLLHRKLARLALLIAAVILPATALAQQEVVEQAGPLAQPIGMKTVEKMSGVLKLDADQKGLVRSLYTGYRASYKQLAADGDKELATLHSKADDKIPIDRKQEFKIAQDFIDKQDKLQKSFLDDLKAVLTPEQADRFERAERARRREVGLRFSFVAGESVDLLQIMSDLKVDRDGTPELKEATEQYEVEADRSMIAKDKMLRDVFKQIDKFEGPEPDPKLIQDMLKEFFANGNRVRDVNRQHARKIEPLLPTEKRAAFDMEIKKLSFPRVYSESHAEKSIKVAQGLADLTADQKTELASLWESYGREAEGANARWSAAIEDKQSKVAGNFMEMMMGGGDEKPDDPLKLARDARKSLDERTVTRVTQILKAEQREKLLKAEEKPGYERPEWEPDFDERGHWDEWKKEDEEPAAKP